MSTVWNYKTYLHAIISELPAENLNGVDISELELEFDKETMYEDVENLFRKGDKDNLNSATDGKVVSVTSFGKYSSMKNKSNLIESSSEIKNLSLMSNDLIQGNLKSQQQSLKNQEVNSISESIPEISHSNEAEPIVVEYQGNVALLSKVSMKKTLEIPTVLKPQEINDRINKKHTSVPTPVAKKAPKKKQSVRQIFKFCRLSEYFNYC